MERVRLQMSPMPRHIAFQVRGLNEFARERGTEIREAYNRSFVLLKDTTLVGIRLNIPVMTFSLLPHGYDGKDAAEALASLTAFLTTLPNWDAIYQHQVKVTVLGRWYDLPGETVEAIKAIIEKTKDYDTFFLNLCINYDGQEEIVDAARLIARQAAGGKIEPDAIDRTTIKENLASSYFPPPDLIVKTGHRDSLQGILLWDAALATIRFLGKPFPELSREDVLQTISWWQEHVSAK